MLSARKSMFGFECEGFWVDVGSLDGYLQATGRVLEKLDSLMDPAAAKDKVWISQNASVDESAHILGPSLIEDRAVVGKDALIGPYTVLKAEARVGDASIIERAALLEGATVGANGAIRVSVVGERATLEDDVIADRSIVGQGSFLKRGVRIRSGSRIWPNVSVESNIVIEGTILLSHDQPFYFNVDVGWYTGILATSIPSLLEAFSKVETQSLEFHLYRRDFERWIRDVVQAPALAESIAGLRKQELRGEMLRQRLLSVIEEWRRKESYNLTAS